MRQGLVRLGSLTAMFLLVATLAYGQGSVTSTLTGTVQDASGGAIPGATVVAKNEGTSVTSETTSSSQGTFTIPALLPGTYSVTVSLTGFKTAVFNGVQLNAGVPAAITVKLEVGGVTETVVVEVLDQPWSGHHGGAQPEPRQSRRRPAAVPRRRPAG